MQTIKILTYNIDGLPEKLDLRDLPWILRPIAWIYKIFKGTTEIVINDNQGKADSIKKISQFIKERKPDVIGVQEDFNYHDDLMSSLDEYSCGTSLGGFVLKNLFSKIELFSHFPLPRFKTDGLNLIYKKDIAILTEDIVKWKKSYGYISHANDLLAHKGFRRYTLSWPGPVIDIYVIHMDADFYTKGDSISTVIKDIETRKSQLSQLVEYIIKRKNDGITAEPSIIIGDTNTSDKSMFGAGIIKEYLIDPINSDEDLEIHEALDENTKDVDRIFYINNKKALNYLNLNNCRYITNQSDSDHYPFEAEFCIHSRVEDIK